MLTDSTNLQKSLYEWILRISSLDSGPACPFAMKAWLNDEVKLVENRPTISELVPFTEEISICIVPYLDISYEDLADICDCYNLEYPEYIFLNSHPDETLTLLGKKTVWEHPAMLIQKKSELNDARSLLVKIGFYKNWDKDMLESLGITHLVSE